jgi:NADH-quinone oxidoreductase subunit A
LRPRHDPTTLGNDPAQAAGAAPCPPAARGPDLEDEMSNPYVPILVLMTVAAVLALGGVGASAIIGPKRYNRAKLEAYECGIDPTPHATGHGRFPVKYYLVAMTFIVFDIEVVFMYPWAVSFSALAMFGVVAMLTFLALITVPFVYEWRRGGFEWD